MITLNLSGQHPLSHEDVPRDVYIHKLQETAIQIVSELKLEDLDSNLKELHYPSILSTLLTKYPQWFYIEYELPHQYPRVHLATWDLITIVFNILENNSYDFNLAPPGVKVKPFFNPATYGGFPIQGAYIKMNESFKDIWLMNATRIEFNSLYPNILQYILDKGDIDFNLPQFPKVFLMMKHARTEVKKMNQESKLEHFTELNSFIKIWLNMAYGVLNSSKAYLRASEHVAKKISMHGNMMMRVIHSEFSGHTVYVDTDLIIFKHFHEISARFVKFLYNPKYVNIPWEEDKVDFIISRLKKYIMKDADGTLCIKGYKRKEVGEG